jgi:hypothetical protein
MASPVADLLSALRALDQSDLLPAFETLLTRSRRTS